MTTIGDMAFAYCRNLSRVVIPGSVTTIKRRAFDGCTSLPEVVIPDSVSRIEEYTFGNCSSLKHVVLPDTLYTIERYAFTGCKSLTEILLPRYSCRDPCVIWKNSHSTSATISGASRSVLTTGRLTTGMTATRSLRRKGTVWSWDADRLSSLTLLRRSAIPHSMGTAC